MRGARTRVLDDGYVEFLEVLQKLGELSNLRRLIDGLASSEGDLEPGIHSRADGRPSGTELHSFWTNGWIELIEIGRESKRGPTKQYRLQVRLDKINVHFQQDRLQKSAIFAEKAALGDDATGSPRAEA